MMVRIVFLIVFFSAAVMPGQTQSSILSALRALLGQRQTQSCRNVNWWTSFNHEGVSKCQSKTEYIRGFYRSGHEGNDEISLLEEAKCCSRDAAFSSSQSQVVFANWSRSFDLHHLWNSCPPGFFLQGLYRNGGSGGLWLIDEGVCSKPATHPHYYGRCTDLDVQVSFNDRGWSSCPRGYFLTGLYRGNCGYLQCLDKFRCCKMASGPSLSTSHDDVKTRVMDTTLEEISLLAHYLGYGNCAGCRAEYVGQDFQRHGDTWVADQTRRCEGSQANRRLSIKYDDWIYELKNITFSEAVITELTPQVLDSGTVINNASNPSTASVKRTEEVVRSVTHTTTSQWTSSYDMGFKIGYSLSFGAASFSASASFNYGYETSTSTTDSTGQEQKSIFTVNQQKTIAAHSAVRWRLVLSKTRRTVSYTATVIPRFSAELRGFLLWGHGYDNGNTNYHSEHRGSYARPYFPYKFGSSSTPFYQALKQESDQSSEPWLWMDMKAAYPGAEELINSLTNENRHKFPLTGKFEDIYGHHVRFYWEEIPITEIGGHYRRSSAQHNETVTVVKTVAKTQAGDPPPVFPDPPQVLLDPGTPFDYEVTERVINDD